MLQLKETIYGAGKIPRQIFVGVSHQKILFVGKEIILMNFEYNNWYSNRNFYGKDKLMKKLSAIAAAVISAAAFTTGAYAAEYGSLTVVGDSIASGYGLSGYVPGDNYSAPDSFGSILGAESENYVNLAVDGRTSAELSAALENEDMTAALSDADSVVISIGGNDFLQPMLTAAQTALFSDSELMDAITSGEEMPDMEEMLPKIADIIVSAVQNVDTSATGDNISAFMEKTRELNPDCDIYILTVYNPFESLSELETLQQTAITKLSELNAEITSSASENGATVIDVHEAFKGHAGEYTNITSMDVHPSKAGHSVIYSLLSSVLKEKSAPAQASPDQRGDAPAKASPDTGCEGLAAISGSAVIAIGLILVFRQKHD